MKNHRTNSIPYQDGYGTWKSFRKERRSKIKTFFDLHDLRFFQGPHSSVLAFRLDQPVVFFVAQFPKGVALVAMSLTLSICGAAPIVGTGFRFGSRIGILVLSFLLVAVGCFLLLVLAPFVLIGQREVP